MTGLEHDHFSGSARVSAQAPHGLRDRRKGIPLARSGSLQLGAGLVRCGTGCKCRQPRTAPALWIVDAGSDTRDKAVLRGAVAPLQPGRELPACAGPEARRPSAAAARQCRAAVGDHAGGDEARRRRDSRDHAARRRTNCATGSIAARRGWWSPRRIRSRSLRASAATIWSASWSARRRSTMAGCRSSRRRTRRKPLRPMARPTPTIRCCSISPRAPRQNQSWCGTASAAIPSAQLSTMYWLGLQPGDVHLNISSPGWAKHAWSCFFAPWNAGATVFVVNQPRFDAKALLADHRPLRRHHAVRAADRVAAVHPGEARRLQGGACARSAAPASRSTLK